MSQWETSSRLVKLVKQVNCCAVNGNQFAFLLNEIWCPLTTHVFSLYLGLFSSQLTGTAHVGPWKQLQIFLSVFVFVFIKGNKKRLIYKHLLTYLFINTVIVKFTNLFFFCFV